jgi:hypothetical protein
VGRYMLSGTKKPETVVFVLLFCVLRFVSLFQKEKRQTTTNSLTQPFHVALLASFTLSIRLIQWLALKWILASRIIAS